MLEFGEKVKQIREERGMTQQSLAEKLYVTRQAVSRWECGARYPDLLTAKKISAILEVPLDELLSGEELRENVEKEPVLAQPVEAIVQTTLYAIAAIHLVGKIGMAVLLGYQAYVLEQKKKMAYER